MRNTIVLLSALALTALTSFRPEGNLSVTSSAFPNGGTIPEAYTCRGADVNPPLHIEHIPYGTKSLALVVQDVDDPESGGYTQWVVWNIPVMRDIPEAYEGGTRGINSAIRRDYQGMCPIEGTHNYHFMVYALDRDMKDVDLNTDKAALEEKMRGHVLATGELVGQYGMAKYATRR